MPKINVLEKAPEIKKEWSEKNKKKLDQYSYKSQTYMWWICEKGHEYKQTIRARVVHNKGCPYCK